MKFFGRVFPGRPADPGQKPNESGRKNQHQGAHPQPLDNHREALGTRFGQLELGQLANIVFELRKMAAKIAEEIGGAMMPQLYQDENNRKRNQG